MEKELNRHREQQDNELFKAYDILSAAGFDLHIEDGFLSVWYRGCNIEMDGEEGIVIVPKEHLEDFYERQDEL